MDRKTYRVALAALGAQASLLHVELTVVGAGHKVDKVDVPVVLVPDHDNDDGDDNKEKLTAKFAKMGQAFFNLVCLLCICSL